MATATKSATKKQRYFGITFHIEGDDYTVSPLPIDPSIGSKTFRLAKQTGDGAVYDLHTDQHGIHCQCMGFLRHGHCQHCDTIRAAQKVFHLG
jgi:hypothetical protein